MATKSLEHDDVLIMLPNAHNCALKRRPLDGDCNFEQLPIPAAIA